MSGAGGRWAWTVTLATVAVVASSCSLPSGGAAETTPAEGPAVTAQPPSGQEDLARYYQQQVSWQRCEGGECATIDVPVDYAKPDGETIKLKMLRVKARGGNAAKGVLFVNPGGPGGSAADGYAKYADYIVSEQIRRNYDIVGVDPRGVGESAPIVCLDARQTDRMLGADPTPDDAAELATMRQIAKDYGAACQQKYPNLLPHLSTVEVAKDMDIARGALKQEKFNLLGKSYGTFLGATYAGLFPTTTGRLVLDGAVAPDLSDEEMNLGQAEGFETATRAYVADCIKEGDCPLGTDVDGGMAKLRDFLKQLDAKPLPVTDDRYVKQLTEGWGSLGLARAMYEQEQWDRLTDALRSAMTGNDGSALFALGGEYADRTITGTYDGNLMQAISAVNCLDRGGKELDEAERQRLMTEFTQKAPTWGPFMVYGSTTCATWPVPQTGKIAKIPAPGAAPILVVGTTRDPATPYAWAQRLADQLESGTLLTYDGDGHTAYLRASQCIDSKVDAYLLDGTVPPDGTRC